MGSTGTTVSRGLSDKFVSITDYFNSPQLQDNIQKLREQYYDMLKDVGVFGSDDAIDDGFKDMKQYKDNAQKRKEHEDYGWNEEVTADEYLKLSLVDTYDVFMSDDELKKGLIRVGNFPRGKISLGEHLHTYLYGANTNGYGRGADARQDWDDVSGFSDFLKNNPQLHLNTNKPMYRGIRIGNKGLKDLQRALRNGDTIDFRGPSSWTLKENVAKSFTVMTLVGQRNQNRVIFENVTKGTHNAMPFLYGNDSEVIYSGKSKFSILSITQNDKGDYYVKVKEVSN